MRARATALAMACCSSYAFEAEACHVGGWLADDELGRAGHVETDVVRDAGFHGYLRACLEEDVVEDELLRRDALV